MTVRTAFCSSLAAFLAAAVVIVASLLGSGGTASIGAGSGSSGLSERPPFDWTAGVASSRLTPGQLAARYGRLPVSFEPNVGQADPRARFVAAGRGYRLFFTREGPTLSLTRGHPAGRRSRSVGLGLRFLGGKADPRLSADRRLAGRVNYMVGNDRSRWRTNVPTFGRVVYRSVYRGIDAIFYGNQGALEYDFRVAPGADPGAIRLGFSGARQVRLDRDGNLLLKVPGGEVRQLAPVSYQVVGGRQVAVSSRFVVGRSGAVEIRTGQYDRARPLVIDPVLTYSTYLGGGGLDQGFAIALDGQGSAYVTGFTLSSGTTGFPTQDPFQASSGGSTDVFVSKLNPAGSAFVYSTYLGGGSPDSPGFKGLAVDTQGSAYVTGATQSSGASPFPTQDPIQANNAGGQDAFVTKLNPAGSALVYSTYLGGGAVEGGAGMAVDGQGSAYLTGFTSSSGASGFPTQSPLQGSNAGGQDAFVTKLNSAGSALVYSTYLGGGAADSGSAIAVDGQGSAYLTGFTDSSGASGFPTQSPLQGSKAGGSDAFATKLNAAGSALVYSTYLGGGGTDSGFDIKVDGHGSAYLTGFTDSSGASGFPTQAPFQPNNAGGEDVFVTKLNAAGSALVYSTYLGGGVNDRGSGIALDDQGSAYVTGSTGSSGTSPFPTQDPIQPNNAGDADAFVTQLNPAGSALVYSTYLGGGSGDGGVGVAVDCAGSAYITGRTRSSGASAFPTQGPIQADNAGGGDDAFAAKISQSASSPRPPCPERGTPGGGVVPTPGPGARPTGDGAVVSGRGGPGGPAGLCGGGGGGGGGIGAGGGGGGGGACFNRLARTAIRARFGARLSSVRVACRPRSLTLATCAVSWRRGRYGYRGTATVTTANDRARTRLRLVRTTRGCRRGCTRRINSG
jgi:hypothetical protein